MDSSLKTKTNKRKETLNEGQERESSIDGDLLPTLTQDVTIATSALGMLCSINADWRPNSEQELRKVRVAHYSVSTGWALHMS
jgi:hypothetical protein